MATAKRGKRRAVKKGVAKKQAQAGNAQQQYALYQYYLGKVVPMNLAQQRFRFTAKLRSMQRQMLLDSYLNQVQWQDLSNQAWLAGQITLRTTANNRTHLYVQHGDMVKAEVFWQGTWQKVWDMRVWDPDHTIQAGQPEYVCNVYDDIYQMGLSQDDFHYNNLHCHEIAHRICTAYKVPMGKIAMGTFKQPKFDQQGISPLDAIIAAYQAERDHTGKRFVVRWIEGKLNVTPAVLNPLLYVMREQLADATFHHVTPDGFATALVGRATVTNKDGTTKKLTSTATQNVAAYGYIRQTQDYDQNFNQQQLDKRVKQDLAKKQTIGRTIDFDHQGIALVRKGDAVALHVPEEGYVGAQSIVWVTDITHDLQPGNYTMTPTVAATPPIALPDVAVKNKNKKKRAVARPKRAAALQKALA